VRRREEITGEGTTGEQRGEGKRKINTE